MVRYWQRENPSSAGNQQERRMRKNGQNVACSVCGTEVYRRPSELRARPTTYCSRACYEVWWNKNVAGHAVSESHWNWKGGKIEKTCQTCGTQFLVIRNYMADGRKFCSRKCYGATRTGDKNVRWKGGVSSERDTAKASQAYADWRIAVFRRDHFKCVMCLKTASHGKLHAHHLKRFSDYPELRYDVDNGATLCAPCHKQTCKLEERFEVLIRSRILRDFTSDTRLPLDIVKIKSGLHGDMERLTEMLSPAA